MIKRVLNEFTRSLTPGDLEGTRNDAVSPLVEPHGGTLIQRMASIDQCYEAEFLPKIKVEEIDLMDCKQIALGTYSPLTGFMDRETLTNVLESHHLPDGTVWTLPIILQVDEEIASKYKKSGKVAITDQDGNLHSILDITESFEIKLVDVAKKWFGTESLAHPGVSRLRQRGKAVLAGDVTLVNRRPSARRPYELSPSQLRQSFAQKGWSRVVGFHTRNVCHRAHEYIQLKALEMTNADGLFINPITGPKKAGDFMSRPIMKSYQVLFDQGDVYPADKIALGSFSTYPRYAGPREAVFTALCRKNLGCSHFIIGRDHTGTGNFYEQDANQKLVEQLGSIGIELVFFNAVGYLLEENRYAFPEEGGDLTSISGTKVRQALRSGQTLPDWFIRDPVQAMLRDEIAAGREIFVP